MLVFKKVPAKKTDLKERVKEALLSMGAIRYVKINSETEDAFFIFKVPGTYLQNYDEVGELGSFNFVAGAPADNIYHNTCFILHNDKLLEREINKEEGIFDGVIEEAYLKKYRKQIEQASEFQLDTCFEAKTRTVSLYVLGYRTENNKALGKVTLVDYLTLKNGDEFKLISPEEFKPICKKLRSLNILRDGRGRYEKQDAMAKTLRRYAVKEYKLMKKNKTFTWKALVEKVRAKADNLMKNQEAKSIEYYRDVETIKEWIQNDINS